jgi:iron complex outermembrane receptor protein
MIILIMGFLIAPALADEETSEDTFTGSEVVVVDDRSTEATDAQATSAAVTVIEVDESLPASSDVSTVVDSASGTTVQRLGGLGDWSGVSIRGSTLRQVQVVLDGIPLNPDGASAVNLSELPLFAFERVEIFRGNAPPELAASPIGGVVHLRTGEGRRGTNASVSHGSLDTSRLTAMTRHSQNTGKTPVDFLAVADLFATEGDFSYYDDNGTKYNLFDDRRTTRQNNDKRQLNTHLRLRLGPRDTRFTLLQAYLSRDEGLPGHANNPTEQVSLQTARSLTAASMDLQRGLSRIEARSWALLRADTYDDREGEVGTGNQHNEDQFGSGGGLVHWQRLFGSHVVGGLTLSMRQDRFITTDLLSEETSNSARRLSFTPALDADIRLWSDRITISPVLQAQILDNRALGKVPFSNTPIAPEASDTLFAPTPRLGLLLRPIGPVALKANGGTYVRPPDFTELFGDRGAIIGNTDLKPERGTQWDVGARAVAPKAWPVQGSVEVGHFWNSVEDLIIMVQNSQRTSVPVNLYKGWIQGFEAALTLQAPFLELQSNLTRNTSVNLSTERQFANNQLPRLPTWELYQRTAMVWQDWLRLGHTWSFTDGNYWDRTNYYLATPRAFHGAFLRLSPGGAWPSIEVDALNLTDRIVEIVPRNPLDPSDDARVVQPTTDFVGYPLPGRTVLVTMRWERLPAGL